jgi:hypothetical protein
MEQTPGAAQKVGFLKNLDAVGHSTKAVGMQVGIAANAPDSMGPQGIGPPLQQGSA